MASLILFEVAPLNGLTPTTIRLTNEGATPEDAQLNGLQWSPYITGLNSRSATWGGDGLLDDVDVKYGSIRFLISSFYGNAAWASYEWIGAQATMRIGNSGDPYGAFRLVFSGTVGSISRDGNIATLELLGPDAAVDTPLLTAIYLGTGNAEGPEGYKGKLKPRLFGNCRSIDADPFRIDPAKQIYQIHGYGPIQEISRVYDFAAPLDPSKRKADQASYADLAALALVPGEWATCLAQGMFRLGATPKHKISCDAALDSGQTVAAIVPKVLTIAGVPLGKQGNFTAFTAPWNAHVVEQTTAGDLARKALKDAGGVLFPDSTGTWQAFDHFSPKAATALNADQSTRPRVLSVREVPVAPPVWKVEANYDRCWGVHSASEVSPALAQTEQLATTANTTAATANTNATTALNAVTDPATGQVINFKAVVDDVAKKATILSLEGEAALRSALGESLGNRTSVLEKRAQLRPNLQVNGGFENSLSGLDGLPASAAIAANSPDWGTYFVHTGNGISAVSMPPINCLEGVTYTISFDRAVIASGGTSRVDISYWTGPNGTGSVTYGESSTTTPFGTNFGDIRQEFSFVVPSGKKSIRVRLVSEGVTGAGAIAWRRLKVERGALPSTAYTADAAAISTVAQIVNEVSTRATQTGALATRADTIEATLNTPNTGLVARITKEEATRVTQFDSLAGRATNIEAKINSRANLQINGGFEKGLDGLLSLPTSASVDILNPLWGSSFNHQASGTMAVSMPSVRVVANATYVVSFDCAIFATTGQVRVDCALYSSLDGSGSLAGYSATSSAIKYAASPNNDFRDNYREEFQFTVPSNINSVRVRLISENMQNVTYIGFRRIKVERGTLPSTPYTSEGTDYSINARITDVDVTRANQTTAVATRTSTLETNYNSLSSSVTVQQGAINGQANQIGDLYNRNAAYFIVNAVSGSNRAQLSVVATANGGAGVDIVGDLSISGNLIVGGTISTDRMTAGAITNTGAFFYDFGSWQIPSKNSWTNINNGQFMAATGVTTANVSGQVVVLNMLITMNRASGNDDQVYVRIRRDDGNFLGQQYSNAVQGQDFSYPYAFIDTGPPSNGYAGYSVEILSNDNTYIKQVNLTATCYKR